MREHAGPLVTIPPDIPSCIMHLKENQTYVQGYGSQERNEEAEEEKAIGYGRTCFRLGLLSRHRGWLLPVRTKARPAKLF